MTRNLAFDTLAYSQALEKGGVEHADVHAATLSSVIIQNIYTKTETDKMIDALIKQMEQNRYESEKRFQQERADSKQDMLELERRISRNFHSVVGILGSLIVVMSAVTTLAHYFIR